MHLIDKIQGWVESGPMGNDKQIDPVTLAVIAGAKTIGSWMDNANEKKARKTFSEELSGIGSEIKSKADKFFDISEDYLPGGDFYNQAQQEAINTSFIAANKGNEMALSKGIDMSSYGTGTMQDVVQEQYTSNFVEDYKEFADIGIKYAGIGQSLYSQYADITTSAGQADYMAQSSSTNPLTDLADLGIDFATASLGGKG